MKHGHGTPAKKCPPAQPYTLDNLTFYVTKEKGKEWAFAEANKHVPLGYTLISLEESENFGGVIYIHMTKIHA